MKYFSYKDSQLARCGVCIKAFKEELAWAICTIRQWFQLMTNKSSKLYHYGAKNKAVLNYKQYCTHVILSNVMKYVIVGFHDFSTQPWYPVCSCQLRSCMFVFNTVYYCIITHYKYMVQLTFVVSDFQVIEYIYQKTY